MSAGRGLANPYNCLDCFFALPALPKTSKGPGMARKHKFDYFDAFVKIGEYAVEYANELVKYMEKNAQIVAEGREPDIAHAIQR